MPGALKNSDWWRVAEAPAAYGSVDDSQLCRHIRVPCDVTLLQLKRSILRSFEDQYEPDQITVFTRVYDDDPKRLSTDRQVHKKLYNTTGGNNTTAVSVVHSCKLLPAGGTTAVEGVELL